MALPGPNRPGSPGGSVYCSNGQAIGGERAGHGGHQLRAAADAPISGRVPSVGSETIGPPDRPSSRRSVRSSCPGWPERRQPSLTAVKPIAPVSSLVARGRPHRVRARPARRGPRRLRGQRLRRHVRPRGLPPPRRQPQPRPRALRLEGAALVRRHRPRVPDAGGRAGRRGPGRHAATSSTGCGPSCCATSRSRPSGRRSSASSTTRRPAPGAASTTCTSGTSARPTRWPTSCCATWPPTGGPARSRRPRCTSSSGTARGAWSACRRWPAASRGDGSSVTEQARDAVDVVLRGIVV